MDRAGLGGVLALVSSACGQHGPRPGSSSQPSELPKAASPGGRWGQIRSIRPRALSPANIVEWVVLATDAPQPSARYRRSGHYRLPWRSGRQFERARNSHDGSLRRRQPSVPHRHQFQPRHWGCVCNISKMAIRTRFRHQLVSLVQRDARPSLWSGRMSSSLQTRVGLRYRTRKVMRRTPEYHAGSGTIPYFAQGLPLGIAGPCSIFQPRRSASTLGPQSY